MTSQTVPAPTTEHPGLRLVPSFVPVGHYPHPSQAHLERPTLALCNRSILGVDTFGHFELCKDCERLAEEQKYG